IKTNLMTGNSNIRKLHLIKSNKYLQETYQIDKNETEYLMKAKEMFEKEYTEATVQVRKAVMTDARSIASFQAKAFESSFQEAMTYAEGCIGEDVNDIFVLFNQDEVIIVLISVITTADNYYILFLYIILIYQYYLY